MYWPFFSNRHQTDSLWNTYKSTNNAYRPHSIFYRMSAEDRAFVNNFPNWKKNYLDAQNALTENIKENINSNLIHESRPQQTGYYNPLVIANTNPYTRFSFRSYYGIPDNSNSSFVDRSGTISNTATIPTGYSSSNSQRFSFHNRS